MLTSKCPVLDLIHDLQDILDLKAPPVVSDVDSSGSEDSDDESDRPASSNSNYQKAVSEIEYLEKFKSRKYRPIMDHEKSVILSGTDDHGKVYEVMVGPVLSRGMDVPSGKNLADYINKKGRMDMLRFYVHHKKFFPSAFLQCKKEAARKVVEVGCERFFALSGYVSAPRRTRLDVRTYERLALLESILRNVYIDDEWVAKEYLKRCKEGAWKKENTKDAVKCWNLERVIEAELLGKQAPEPEDFDSFVREAMVLDGKDKAVPAGGDNGVDVVNLV